jgi:hypothetical protein
MIHGAGQFRISSPGRFVSAAPTQKPVDSNWPLMSVYFEYRNKLSYKSKNLGGGLISENGFAGWLSSYGWPAIECAPQ